MEITLPTLWSLGAFCVLSLAFSLLLCGIVWGSVYYGGLKNVLRRTEGLEADYTALSARLLSEQRRRAGAAGNDARSYGKDTKQLLANKVSEEPERQTVLFGR